MTTKPNDDAALSAALSVPAAAVVGEPERDATIRKVVGLCNRIPGATTWNAAEWMYDELTARKPVAWPVDTDDQVEALARECDWDNRKYMTPKDYAIWCERMRKFARLAAPSAPDGWQPIETAPKDETTIWVLDELYGKPWHYECNWNGIEWYHGFGVAWPDARPTHWRPLPAPPAIGGASHD